jgi:hypothetical protein
LIENTMTMKRLSIVIVLLGMARISAAPEQQEM